MQKYVNGANAVKKKPLLSVIIPTYKRPQYLPRAINSAVQAAPDGDVEVIVVPNGPDDSWKNVAKKYQSEPRVQWRSEEHTSELQSLMSNSYAVFCLKKQKNK